MIFKRICHIGMVLPTIEDVHAFMKQYGLEVFLDYETPYQARCIFTKAGPNESPIEFLVPSGGPLKEYNGGKGGIHHICYEVDDIEEASNQLRAMGVRLLEDEPVLSKTGAKLNFVRPSSSYGILVELMEGSPT